MNAPEAPATKNRFRPLLFAGLALMVFAVIGAAFAWKAAFSDPQLREGGASVILVAVPSSMDKSPHGVISAILKGKKDAHLQLSAGSPMLGLFEDFADAPQPPEALVVFMAPQFGVAGPLKAQATAAVYDGKIDGTDETLEAFSRRLTAQ